MNARPVPDVAAQAIRHIHQLTHEWQHEAEEARWPSAPREPATVHTGQPTDPTHKTAAHPDPTNTHRAQELEQALRQAARIVADALERPQRNRIRTRQRTSTCTNCRWKQRQYAGRCDPCYRWWRRTGQERPQHLIEAERQRKVFA